MSNPDQFLQGKLLIAMPSISDERFERTVIFMCVHASEGAMGLIINRVSPDLTLGGMLAQLDRGENDDDDATPDSEIADAIERWSDRPIHIGGPVETKRGFVLHSDDYFAEGGSVRVSGNICLTASVDILQDMLRGKGPEQALLALGYAGWSPGQIEAELQANGWLHADAEPEILFTTDIEERYAAALNLIGVDPSFLASTGGHA